MAKKHSHKSVKAHVQKPFDLEDARRLFVVRHFMLTIEKKLIEIVAADDKVKENRYKDAVKATQEYLTALDDIQPTPQKFGGDCWDDYEDCGGGVCRVWCS